MSTTRQVVPYHAQGEVSAQQTIPIPIKDEDGNNLNLDGKTITCRVKDPSGNGGNATSAAQRAAGSHIIDVVHTWDEAGTWIVSPRINGELLSRDYAVCVVAAI